jgi:ribosome-binding protein aMBF1 (putative translation factor)
MTMIAAKQLTGHVLQSEGLFSQRGTWVALQSQHTRNGRSSKNTKYASLSNASPWERIPKVHGDRKHFGRNLSRLRSAAGFTQEVLAEKSEISVRYVQFIESGRYVPTVIVAARLRTALGCSWNELCAGM